MDDKKLTLPPFEYQVRRVNGQIQIFDVIRKQYVILTPEEWVRQHFIHFLAGHRNYPLPLIAVEQEIDVFGQRKRFDIVCHDRRGLPHLIVECKSPSVHLSQSTFDQVFQYNLAIAARYVAITNGCQHFCGEITEGRKFRLLPSIPYFENPV